MTTPVETAIAQVVDRSSECGVTAADIDQEATLLRERLSRVLKTREIAADSALAVAAGVWVLQGVLLSDHKLCPEGSEIASRIGAASNLAILWVNQILQGARAAELVAELMSGAE